MITLRIFTDVEELAVIQWDKGVATCVRSHMDFRTAVERWIGRGINWVERDTGQAITVQSNEEQFLPLLARYIYRGSAFTKTELIDTAPGKSDIPPEAEG